MPEIDCILAGKGPSFGTFAWDKVLEPTTVVAINETVLCIPREACVASIIGVVQDVDPVRRILAAWKDDDRVQQVWASDYSLDGSSCRPPFRMSTVFRACDVPKASTACVALWFIRKWWGERHADYQIKVGCVGFDAYFGRTGPVYAKAVQDAVKEPISRSPDYTEVNRQITRWARETNCRLIDLGAESPE